MIKVSRNEVDSYLLSHDFGPRGPVNSSYYYLIASRIPPGQGWCRKGSRLLRADSMACCKVRSHQCAERPETRSAARQFAAAFLDHGYKLHWDLWRLRSFENGGGPKQEVRDQPDQQISVAISSRAKKPCSVIWQAEQHRAGSRVADSSI